MFKAILAIAALTLGGCEIHNHPRHYTPEPIYQEVPHAYVTDAYNYCPYGAQWSDPYPWQPMVCEYSYNGDCCTWHAGCGEETWCWFNDACGWEYVQQYCGVEVFVY